MTQIARPEPGGLKPLSPDLDPRVLTWAGELRVLWCSTGLSINRFVRLHPHVNKGTVSRYLNGERVPTQPWFLDTLMAEAGRAGRPLTPAVREHLIALGSAALEAAHPHEYKVRLVSDELKIAQTRRLEAERYARGLEEQLAERIRQVEQLAAAEQQVRAAWDVDRTDMQVEHERLQSEIDTLIDQLNAATDRGDQADLRCQQLEGLLDHLDPQADEGQDGIPDGPPQQAPNGTVAARSAEHLHDREIIGLFDGEAQRLDRYVRWLGATPGEAEEVVREAFLIVRCRWHWVRDSGAPYTHLYGAASSAYWQMMESRGEGMAGEVADGAGADRKDLVGLLSVLDMRERQVVALLWLCGFTVADTSEILAIGRQAVTGRLRRATQILITQCGPDLDGWGGVR